MLGCRRCFQTTPSRQNLYGSVTQAGMAIVWKTHTEDKVKVTGDVHAYDLDGHATPLVCAVRYVGEAPALDFLRAL